MSITTRMTRKPPWPGDSRDFLARPSDFRKWQRLVRTGSRPLLVEVLTRGSARPWRRRPRQPTPPNRSQRNHHPSRRETVPSLGYQVSQAPKPKLYPKEGDMHLRQQLEKWAVKDLRELARDLGITGLSRITKPDLVDKLLGHDGIGAAKIISRGRINRSSRQKKRKIFYTVGMRARAKLKAGLGNR